ncbi:hypothetical protein BDZ94DRAFT_1306598 [Collybia nuda]|uniref:Uncharacterized protein n=1 Tax=Collybia nuda TaxID=64659 RepID=A0A9P5Y944_9AGAR|nr:hypothetical protein BDZ94DRAFT_1306598 [Collybia nuda]
MPFSWVDWDMFMCYLGGAIGHQNQDVTQTPEHQQNLHNDTTNIVSDPEDGTQMEEWIITNPDTQLQELCQMALKATTLPAESDNDIGSGSENTSNIEDSDYSCNTTDEGSDYEPYFGPNNGKGENGEDNHFGDF